MTSATGSRRWPVRAALALGLTLALATAAAPAAEPQVPTGRLGFEFWLTQSGPYQLPCSLGLLPDATACVSWKGSERVPGLGSVSVTYDWLLGVGPPACPAGLVKPLETSARLGVAGKGTIGITFAEGAHCVPERAWSFEPREFTITGGTGRFAGASGRGTRERLMAPGAPGTETWTGILEVPGLVFDLAAPRLHGVVSRTVQARKGAESARVTFSVTATDGVDGDVPVSCRPRSGNRFAIGRTRVRCHATDSSANVANAAFTVAVTRGR